jgi:hypothetical protein
MIFLFAEKIIEKMAFLTLTKGTFAEKVDHNIGV